MYQADGVESLAEAVDSGNGDDQHLWPQLRRDYPPNLSILISGGKETNKDSLSNGE